MWISPARKPSTTYSASRVPQLPLSPVRHERLVRLLRCHAPQPEQAIYDLPVEPHVPYTLTAPIEPQDSELPKKPEGSRTALALVWTSREL